MEPLPMWTTGNRARYDRSMLRYASDLTDAEWGLIAPLIPPAKRGGNKRTVEIRAVVDGLMYVLSTGCQWRGLAQELPAPRTAYRHLLPLGYDRPLWRHPHPPVFPGPGE